MTAQEQRLYHRLQLAAHAAQKYSDRSLQQATGLTTAQMSVLTVVATGGQTTQSDVARALGVSESAVTTMVTRLEARGCLRRVPSADDRRAWALQLTDIGKEALAAARSAFKSVNRILDDAMSDEEARALGHALTTIRAAFDEQST